MTTTTAHDRRTVDPPPPAGTIVVGFDGSDSSLQALAWAAEQAAAQRLHLTLAHAVLPPDAVWLDPASLRTQNAQVGIDLARAREVAGGYVEDAHVHECVRVGDPRDLLRELAQDAAELVIGSRGRGPVRSLLLGSVGVSMSRHAGCPVVIHRGSSLGPVHTGVVAGVDGTERSRSVLKFAFDQAQLRGLPLTVLHCVWDAQAAAVGPALLAGGAAAVFVADTEETVESARLLVAETIAGFCQDYSEVPVRTELAKGLAADALVRFGDRGATSWSSAATTVGSRPRSCSVRSRTDVVEHAHCPVAVVPVD